MAVVEKGRVMGKPAAKPVAVPSESREPNRLAGLATRTTGFLRDVRGEMRKVVTPSRQEVRTTTTVVIVTVFAFAAYFYVVDAVLGRGIQGILHWLGGTQ